MNRRTFLTGAAAVAGLAAVGTGARLVLDDDDDERSGPRDGRATRTYGDEVYTRRRPPSKAPNVLMISLDDCNDWLGFLNNHPGTSTPNFDALAAESLIFTSAYCCAPMCLPSRTATLFGRHPFDTEIYDHTDPSRANYSRFAPRTPSLVDDFWRAGYDTVCAGKIFHDTQAHRWTTFARTHQYVNVAARGREGIQPEQWDPNWLSPYDNNPIGSGDGFPRNGVDFGPSGKSANDDPDGRAALWVARQLNTGDQRPQFLAFGVANPHEPWRVPQQFFDLHPIEGVVPPDVSASDLDDLPPYARNKIVDVHHIFESVEGAGILARVVQAYQASISYADYCAGIALNELAASPRADETIVLLWSDHGYHLGEKLHLEKQTLWERGTRVPFLCKVPGRFDDGERFDEPVSLFDMGPTLTELCGIECNAGHAGASLLPEIADPALAAERPAITTWKEGNHAVRRGPWRYIRYVSGDQELYDHRSDPDEKVNLALDASSAPMMTELDAFLPPPPPSD
jgi:arylsulfatase A-like enzyme